MEINRALTAPLILLLAFCLALPKNVSCQEEQWSCEKRLEQEIQLLNLLKGLYLSDEQMRFLIEKAKMIPDSKEAAFGEYKRYAQVSTQILENLKGELVEDKGVSKDVTREVHQRRKKIVELKAAHEQRVEKIVAEVKNNLTSKQLHILEEFKPCLVPRKGPARFGQADDPKGAVKQLEHIRKMPDYRYSLKKHELVEKILQRALLHKPRGIEIDEDELRSKILAIFDEARGLPEVDFNLGKEELAKRLKDEVSPAPKKEVDIDAKIERFLLNPAVISILEEKI